MPDVQLKQQRYRDERPAEYFDRFHARTRDHGPEGHVYELVRTFTVSYALAAFRARSIGSENVPAGALILAPNHASFMDHFFAGAFVRRRIQFMAKSQLFGSPVPSYVFSHGGVFPIRRGAADEEAFRPRSRCSTGAARWACTARAAARATASWPSVRVPGSAGWRWSRARRSFRSRSSAPIRSATGGG